MELIKTIFCKLDASKQQRNIMMEWSSLEYFAEDSTIRLVLRINVMKLFVTRHCRLGLLS
jgi:hypothetical protein